jgi:hypothetical protein
MTYMWFSLLRHGLYWERLRVRAQTNFAAIDMVMRQYAEFASQSGILARAVS